MDFSLSSSLVGSAVSNPDKLALDLQFATDKTLTARKGPTPVFTRGSAGRFVGSNGLIQSAIANTPRFDHEPLTGVCKGLLIEEQRTNLVLQSENFGTTWQTNGASITLNIIASPDGATTADRLNEDATTGNHQVVQQVGSLTAGQPYTISVFAKAASHTTFQITTSSAAFGSGLFANFILTGSGSIGASSGVTARIESYLNGWYRCSIAISSVTGGTGGFVQIAANNNNSTIGRLVSYLGTNAQVVHLWGAQLELGSFATSYIPTTTASVIRSADVCSISGSDFSGFYNPLEGSFATSQIFNAPASSATGQVVFDINDTTTLNRTRIPRNSLNGVLYYSSTVGGVQDVSIIGLTSIATGVVTKLAGCMKANDFTVYLNNVSQGVDTMCAMQLAPTTLTIGDTSAGAPRAPLNGTIGSLRYYKKRLSNEKLQALTV